MNCELCEREIERLTVYHLVPRQSVKRKQAEPGSTINICSACHQQLHILLDNKEFTKNFNTLEKLKAKPKVQKFLSWVKKQKPNKRVRTHRQFSSN